MNCNLQKKQAARLRLPLHSTLIGMHEMRRRQMTRTHRKHATITHVRTTDDTNIKSYHTRMTKLEIFVKEIKIVRPSRDVTENRFTWPWPARATKRTKLRNFFKKAMREREPGKGKIRMNKERKGKIKQRARGVSLC